MVVVQTGVVDSRRPKQRGFVCNGASEALHEPDLDRRVAPELNLGVEKSWPRIEDRPDELLRQASLQHTAYIPPTTPAQ